jgi:hypothetical protein
MLKCGLQCGEFVSDFILARSAELKPYAEKNAFVLLTIKNGKWIEISRLCRIERLGSCEVLKYIYYSARDAGGKLAITCSSDLFLCHIIMPSRSGMLFGCRSVSSSQLHQIIYDLL